MWRLSLVLLAACPPEPLALPLGSAPTPPSFHLEVDPAVAGSPTVVRATGVSPGATVSFSHSGSGFGTWCPPALAGSCLDILPTVKVFGSAVADPTGTATLPLQVPPVTADRRYGVQAAILGVPAGTPAAVSNAVLVWSAPAGTDVSPGADVDGDGQLRGDGDCDDGDPAIGVGFPDTPGDGVDADCDGLDGADHDRDGFFALSGGGDDCDDEAATVHPGADERCDLRDNDCNGTADEGWPDVDVSGTPDCREVAVVVTWGFQEHDLPFWTCDGQLPVARELQAVEDALGSAGLGMVRIDEDASAGVDASQLAPYGAVVLHNGGWGNELRSATVDALLALPDKPLVFLGDDVGLVADQTATLGGRPELYALTHIGAFLHNGNLAWKGLGAVRVDPDHPVVRGPAGPVGSFAYAADFDHVELAGQGEHVLMAKDQVGTPVAWVMEDAGRRSAVLMPSVHDNNVCPVSDPPGLDAIGNLLANTAWWVLRME